MADTVATRQQKDPEIEELESVAIRFDGDSGEGI